MDKPLNFTAIIPASIKEVWQAWTTEAGVKTFFASECRIDLRSGGAYEMYFNLEAPPDARGSEGCIILAIEPMKMLSITWNAPPEMPLIRSQRTHVTIHVESVAKTKTKLNLKHDGWGTGAEWLTARSYFRRAWGKVVIPRLIQRFTAVPVQKNK